LDERSEFSLVGNLVDLSVRMKVMVEHKRGTKNICVYFLLTFPSKKDLFKTTVWNEFESHR